MSDRFTHVEYERRKVCLDCGAPFICQTEQPHGGTDICDDCLEKQEGDEEDEKGTV